MSEQHCPSTLLLLSLLFPPYSVNSDESPSQLLISTDSLFAIYQHPLGLKTEPSYLLEEPVTDKHAEGVRSSSDTTFTYPSTKLSKDTRQQQQQQQNPL
ncbi:hypothetical protein INR49_023465 [Caranx melampygus]|nr:hypothetical protein INR49_023465 [Caranx melampygus]